MSSKFSSSNNSNTAIQQNENNQNNNLPDLDDNSRPINESLNDGIVIQKELNLFRRLVQKFEQHLESQKPINFQITITLKSIERQSQSEILKENIQNLFDNKFLYGLMHQIYDSQRKQQFAFEEFDEWEQTKVKDMNSNDRDTLLNKYTQNHRSILLDIFDAKDATIILIKMLSLQPTKVNILLKTLIELWQEKKCNFDHNYFFNKDLNDVIYFIITNLKQLDQNNKNKYNIKCLISIIITSENYINLKFVSEQHNDNHSYRIDLIKKIINYHFKDNYGVTKELIQDLFVHAFTVIFKDLKATKYKQGIFQVKQNELVQMTNKLQEFQSEFNLDSKKIHNKLLDMIVWSLKNLSLVPLNSLLDLMNHEYFLNYIFQSNEKCNGSVATRIIVNLKFLPQFFEKHKEILKVVNSMKQNSSTNNHNFQVNNSNSKSDSNLFDCKQLDNTQTQILTKSFQLMQCINKRISSLNKQQSNLIMTNVIKVQEDNKKKISTISALND